MSVLHLKGISHLDTWVFDKVERFLNESFASEDTRKQLQRFIAS